MPCDYSNYPKNWKKIRKEILERAENKCELCGAENGKPHWKTGSKVVLTIAHLDQNRENNAKYNLRALCQRCHNIIDLPYRIKRRGEKKMIKFKLGTVLKDTVTDFEGTAIARVVYLNGCVRYEIQPRELKDGNRIESSWIDETQLITKKEGTKVRGKGDPGGPGDIPSIISHP